MDGVGVIHGSLAWTHLFIGPGWCAGACGEPRAHVQLKVTLPVSARLASSHIREHRWPGLVTQSYRRRLK